jgi:hypothetical protein
MSPVHILISDKFIQTETGHGIKLGYCHETGHDIKLGYCHETGHGIKLGYCHETGSGPLKQEHADRYGGMAWSGLIWLLIRTCGGLL